MNFTRPLKILLLEDDPNDAALVQELLETENIPCEVKRVETREAFLSSLTDREPDLILADYTLPSFDGLSALRMAIERFPGIPFLFVSGTLGEEVAIEALKIGATDYILKTRLSRLVPSTLRALREARERADRKRAEDALRRSEAYLAEAQRLSSTGSFGWNLSTGELCWSDETFRIFDLTPETKPTIGFVIERTYPEDRHFVRETIERACAMASGFDVEHRLLMSDGSVKHLRVVANPPDTGQTNDSQLVGAITDISEQKRADAALRRSQGYLTESQRLTHSGSWAWSVRTQEGFWSPEMFRIFAYDPETTKPSVAHFLERVHPDDRARVQQVLNDELQGLDIESDYRIVLPDGTIRHIHAIAHPVTNEAGEITEIIGTSMDVTKQHEARAALEMAFEEIKTLKERLFKENIALREEIDRSSMFEEIVGRSAALQAVLVRVTKVAPTDSTILITGETGSGKELIARAIHKRSLRSARAFVSVNCAAIPTSLITSELFGHEKGAFTGAAQRRLGRFELAEEGTIFLDEIGELPHETQIALLRVLQEREFERVGSSKPIKSNVRVIAATNRNLEDCIAAGTFRRDLYYRLNVFPIEMPTLRERTEDIPLLVEYFVDRYANKTGKKIRGIHTAALERLKSYPWPGNIRELQNVIERSIILCEDEIFTVDESWLSAAGQLPPVAPAVFRMPRIEERKTIEAALADSFGRVSGPSGAAAKLGIPPSTLDSKIRSLRINKNQFRTA